MLGVGLSLWQPAIYGGGMGWLSGITPPSGIAPGLAMDFAGQLYAQGGSPATLSSLMTTTRAGSASYFDGSGVLQTAGADTPRIGALLAGGPHGLLAEGARTNMIRNSTMVGAVAGTPGTLPSNWSASGAGLSYNVLAVQTIAGIPCIDLRIFGTATSTSIYSIFNEFTVNIPSTQGQVWTGSVFLSLLAGSLANTTIFGLGFTESTSGGAGLTTGIGFQVPITGALTRYAYTRTLTDASAVRYNVNLRFNVTTGAAVDMTLRIGLPQLAQGAFASTPIATAGATATRNVAAQALAASAFSAGGFGGSQGTVLLRCEARPSGIIAAWDDGTVNNMHSLGISASNAYEYKTVVAGAATTISTGTHTPGTLAKVALRWKAGDCALSINGGAVVTSAPAAVPTGITTLRLGQLADGTLPQFGTDALLAAWSTGLSNSDLIALST